MTLEKWKPVFGFEGFYEVSSIGRVKTIARSVWFTSKKGGRFQRLKRAKFVYVGDNGHGYKLVWLNKNNVTTVRTVHSLVAVTFIGPYPNKQEVSHKNGIRSDNRLENLEYKTRAANHRDKIKHGTFYLGATQAKLRISEIPKIRRLKGKKSAGEVGLLFGVGSEAIRRVWSGQSWKYI